MKFNDIRKINLMKFFNLGKYDRQIIFLITIVIFILANILVSTLSFRLDLSNGKAYTLSNSTKKIIGNLDDIVNIKFFVSSDLPTRLIPLKTDVTDLLNEYKNQSKGKILIKILDPKKDQNALNEAKDAGIPELSFSQLEQDKYAVTTSYFGIEISYGSKKDVIPQVTDIESLEYNLTSSIYKLVNKALVKIGIVGQENSQDPQQDQLATLKSILGKQFDINFLDLSGNTGVKSIDSSIKTVLVFDTDSKEYNANELKLLKNYLDNAGKAIFFVDGVWVSDNLTTSSSKSNLFSLLADYGIKVENNLILSTSASLVNFGGGQMSLLIPYPFWLKSNNFNSKFSYFSNLSQLVYPWTSSINIVKKSDIDAQYLVKTSNKSWAENSNFDLNPQNILQPRQNDFKEFIISAQVINKNNGSEIVVIASSRFVLERFLGQSTDNLEFVLNLLNNLASGGALSGIRSRSISFYPLPDLPENQKDIFRYLNTLLLPALFAFYGGVRLFKRR